MNKSLSLVVSLLAAGSVLAQSPITLGNANMPTNNDTLRYSVADLNSVGNYTQTGVNYSWNFSSLNPNRQGVRSFKNAFQTPYAFFFVGFNEYGEKIADTIGAGPFTFTDYYNFYKKQTSPAAFVADGAGITYSGVPLPAYYSDKDELYNFPMSYPKYDSTTFRFSTSTNTNVPIKYSKTGYRVTRVDGWGTIITPFGSASCLRLITTQYSQDSVKNTNFPQFNIGFPNYQRSYQWLTTSTKIPYLEVNGTLFNNNFTPTQVRYRDIPRTLTSVSALDAEPEFSMYPNPVQDHINFVVNGGSEFQFEVTTMSGQLICTETVKAVQTEVVKVNLSELSPGIYIGKLSSGKRSGYFKFVKE